jgi:glycosyltransferase involved in cell wall biosynthesis
LINTMPYRVAFQTSHVIQYQAPMFRYLAAHPDIDLTVLFGSRAGSETYLDVELGVELKWDIDLLSGYPHRFLKSYRFGAGPLQQVTPGLIREIRHGNFDAVIVSGWGTAAAWITISACQATGTPFFLYGDNSFIPDEHSTRSRIRSRILGRIVKGAAGALSMGTMNADYYRHYGMPDQKIFHFPYAVENERFFRDSQLTVPERESLRAKYGIDPDRVVIIFPGKLIERKNPLHVLEAVTHMKHRDQVAVAYLGDGAEQARLERFAADNGLGAVHFLGFVNQAEIPRTYAMADVMVLPSSFDPRGTVTNEAMASGLPVVVSDMVGVYGDGDIVRDGDNGFVYPVGSNVEFARHLDSLVASPELRERMGRRSREIISTWNFEADVKGLLKAMRATTGREP